MEFHRGRLIEHVHLRVSDLEASKRFYRAVLQALGKDQGIREGDTYFSADELWIDRADQRVSTVHLAFQSASPAAVAAFMQRLSPLAAETTVRRVSASTILATMPSFALDPDGNNIEAVYHGPVELSAESVIVRPKVG